MELTWFRRPAPDRPGTLNLCYNALDRHVVAGHADAPAVVTRQGPVSYAVLLEQVAALAGALLALGVAPASRVRWDLDDPYAELLTLLATARLGAIGGGAETPVLLVTDRPEVVSDAPVRLLRAPTVGTPDVDWDLAMRAGRQDPAGCADVDPDAVAYVVDGRSVTVLDAVGDPSGPGRLLAALCERRAVELG